MASIELILYFYINPTSLVTYLSSLTLVELDLAAIIAIKVKAYIVNAYIIHIVNFLSKSYLNVKNKNIK